MSFSVQLSTVNLDKIVKKLENIPKEENKALKNALIESSLLVHAEAVKSISQHRSKGETYTRGTREHTASKPGYPPNTDTGDLVRSIGWEIDTNNLTSVIGTNKIHGAWMEFGTKNVAARPWLFPAYKKNFKAIQKLFTDWAKWAIK